MKCCIVAVLNLHRETFQMKKKSKEIMVTFSVCLQQSLKTATEKRECAHMFSKAAKN
jgi:hypothetical protein